MSEARSLPGTQAFRQSTKLNQNRVFTVATAPSSHNAGETIYVSDGAGGSAILAFSDGTNWKRCDTGATIAAS